MKTIANLHAKLDKARKLTWTSFCLLLLTLSANSLVKMQPVVIMALTLLPLIIFVPGMLKEHYKSLSMLCFVTLLYFIVSVTNLFAPTRNGFDIVETILIIILFNAAMLFSRWKQYSLYQTDGE